MKKHLADFWFIYGLLGTIGLAALVPGWGAPGGWLQPAVTTKLAIIFIFFMQGLMLPTEALVSGIKLWRLHSFIEATIFILFPLVTAILTWPFKETLGDPLWTGFLFLAILPCTISTAVVFTTQAEGNIAVALFNASVANIAGILIVPSFCTWLIETEGVDVPVLALIGKIVLLILVPVIVGQVVRFLVPALRNWSDRCKKPISRVNSCVVLFIIFCAFCGSFHAQVWMSVDNHILMLSFALALALVVIMKLILFAVLRCARVGYADAVAAFYCGCQKTVAAGVPMAQGIFVVSTYDVGLVLLPLMCYAPLQFTIGAVIVALLEKKASRAVA